MKRKLPLALLAVFTVLMAYDGLTRKAGAPAGRSGSLGDGGSTCASATCHSGPAPTTQQILISSSLDSLVEYKPDETYRIRVTLTAPGVNRFGFQASVEDLQGNKLGSIIPLTDGRTQKVGDNITHQQISIDASDETFWEFDWLAPSVPNDSMVVSVAANFANNDGVKTGDVIATNFKTYASVTGGFGLGEASPASLKIYPNPSQDWVQWEHNEPVLAAKVYNNQGQLVLMRLNPTEGINVQGLLRGMYQLVLETEKEVYRESFVKH